VSDQVKNSACVAVKNSVWVTAQEEEDPCVGFEVNEGSVGRIGWRVSL